MYFCYCKWIWMNIAYLWDQDCGNIDWSDEINIYQALRTNFVRNIKQQMFSLLLKLKTNMLIINHFICKYKLHGMVTRRIRVMSTMSLIFNVTLYTLLHFLLGTQKLNTILNNLSTCILNLTTCWVISTMFYKKGDFHLTMSASAWYD